MSRPLVAVQLDEWIDPELVYVGRFADLADSFWLDAGPGSADGWSWVGGGSPEAEPAVVRDVVCALSGEPAPEAAGRFHGGWIGWLAYEDAAARAGAPTSVPDAGIPQQLWLRVDRFVAFDHRTRRAWAIAPATDAASLARSVHTVPRHPGPRPPRGHRRGIQVDARHTPDEYATLIERCRNSIREGDAYQLCLTTRFETAQSVDPLETYLRLRERTPAHHGGMIRSGPVSLLSASPELFLEVEDGVVRTHPIKGTRPRGRDAASDAALAAELAASEKERAENVMIVDLMRNDLSRVSEPGSVGVDQLFAVESYPAVHQLVSTVSGRLRADETVGDVLDATFPAGSMTGAPKLSAMSILHRLEGAPRGVFSGCFGWVGDDGALDLAMVIRSIVVHPGGAYVGAGGGITWRSDAAAEVAEVGIKARGPLAALGADLPPGW